MSLKCFRDRKVVLALSTSLLACYPCIALAYPLEDQQILAQSNSAAAPGTADGGASSSGEGSTYAERMAAEEAAQQQRTTAAAAAQKKANEEAAKEAVRDKALDAAERKTGFELKTEEPISASSSSASRASSSAPTSSQPLKLYGRIEELSAGVGARIPLKMKAMVPMRDTSLDTKLQAKATTLSAAAAETQTYPVDFRGSWSGEVTINSSNFDPSYFASSPEESRKESTMMKPGTKGQYNVTFYQDRFNKIQMQPSQIVFQGSESMGSQMKILEKSNPQMGAMFGNNPMMSGMQVPVMFSLHMGTPISSAETGVTGNQLRSDLMKSNLRQLSKDVVESQIVTKEFDRDPQTGVVRNGFSESVLRFTHLNNNRLYLQAAYVYYRADGHFQCKYIFYGTLDRSNGQSAATPNPMSPFGGLLPGMGGAGNGAANPFGGLMPGGAGAGGGAQNLQQQMNQMQNMLKKMTGQ